MSIEVNMNARTSLALAEDVMLGANTEPEQKKAFIASMIRVLLLNPETTMFVQTEMSKQYADSVLRRP